MNQNIDYSLWLFLDLEGYGEGNAPRILEKAVRKTPEFKGVTGKRLYFQFKTAADKANFIFTVSLELNRQSYRWRFVTETDSGIPTPKSPEPIKKRNRLPAKPQRERVYP